MGLHRKSALSGSRRRVFGSAAAVLGVSLAAITVSMAAPPLAGATSISATSAPMAQPAPGHLVRTSATITRIGRPAVSTYLRTRHPSTRVPAGVQPGDLLVSYVGINGIRAAQVHCPSHWTRAINRASDRRNRLVACWTFAHKSQRRPEVHLRHPRSASMVTVAFRGVSADRPVAKRAAHSGRRIHRLAGLSTSDVLVLGEASRFKGHPARAPRTAQLLATTQVYTGGARAGLAVATATPHARSLAVSWRNSPTTTGAVNAALVLRPATTVIDYQSVQTVGPSLTAAARTTSSISTDFPAATSYGDLLVSWVETQAAASISCPSGWSQPVNTISDNQVRLAACVGWAKLSSPPSAAISPASGASIVTTDYRGVAHGSTMSTQVGMAGLATPAIKTTTPGEVLSLGEGSDSWQAIASAPADTAFAGTVNDGHTSQVAAASATAMKAGLTPGFTWSTSSTNGSAAVGVLALKPGTMNRNHPLPIPRPLLPVGDPTPSPTPPRRRPDTRHPARHRQLRHPRRSRQRRARPHTESVTYPDPDPDLTPTRLRLRPNADRTRRRRRRETQPRTASTAERVRVPRRNEHWRPAGTTLSPSGNMSVTQAGSGRPEQSMTGIDDQRPSQQRHDSEVEIIGHSRRLRESSVARVDRHTDRTLTIAEPTTTQPLEYGDGQRWLLDQERSSRIRPVLLHRVHSGRGTSTGNYVHNRRIRRAAHTMATSAIRRMARP